MTAVTYAIVFTGEIVEGFQIISVKAHVAKLLKADATKIGLLFSGKPIVIKKTQDKAEALKYGSALKKVGANVRVKVLKDKAPIAASPSAAPKAAPRAAPAANQVAATAANQVAAPKATAPSAKPTPKPKPAAAPVTNFSLAPNEGPLFDPTPEVAPLDIDLSNLSLGENDGTLLTQPKAVKHAEIDLSEYSVAQNDGSPLVKAAPAIEKVEAPDFGLDEPGAMLETLHEEVELLNPDTSGMSLAFPGSDLLNPEEKDQGPAPEAPDTSSIKLVPNRAAF
ncbi:MAG: hypothetical protein ACI9FB_002845 [Candidatus Azotimanducaceae bacterium]|jgi:hypothetical protein